jgi:hypothetical protein
MTVNSRPNDADGSAGFSMAGSDMKAGLNEFASGGA